MEDEPNFCAFSEYLNFSFSRVDRQCCCVWGWKNSCEQKRGIFVDIWDEFWRKLCMNSWKHSWTMIWRILVDIYGWILVDIWGEFLWTLFFCEFSWTFSRWIIVDTFFNNKIRVMNLPSKYIRPVWWNNKMSDICKNIFFSLSYIFQYWSIKWK